MQRRAERRLVTCVFVDVVGSTDLTVELGPERMQRSLDRAFQRISVAAAAHGGTIEKYIGDAVFMLFGAPVARADDPERALRTAEACVAEAGGAGPASALAVRVGVETGEALVDLDAIGRDRQRMVLGACVNLAARLQSQAGPGQVLVGPTCYAATAHLARFEELGHRELKGLGEVPVRRLVRVTGAPAPTPLPFIGRAAELAA
ncbi:MAG: adenylate/guanylate cyclase domain-containing protein, partial [Candidatus Limnocylindria bacterium]